MKKKIIVTGGSGRFGDCLKKFKSKHNIFFPKKNTFNILNINNMSRYLQRIKPDMLVHLAGLSRPMSIHDKDIKKSIELNIIGTANVTKVCSQHKVKLIYFSTNYVYPGVKGNYSETDSLFPVNNYAWSKLGGECSVQLYENSLIVRVCMTEKPFLHKNAFANVKSSFMYHEDVAKILFKLLNKKGIINVGGKKQYIYDFAKKDNDKVRKSFLKRNAKIGMPFDSSMNIKKLRKIIK
tara:strand:- start:615 stop:1325 length:711 start_codon:yes stop_codon:yes gene_type:complete